MVSIDYRNWHLPFRHWDISSHERFDILKEYTNNGLEHWGSDHKVNQIWVFAIHEFWITASYENYPNQRSFDQGCSFFGRDGQVVRSLNPCSMCPGFETTCHKVWGENLSALCSSRLKGKRDHQGWSHKEEGLGLHCLISLPIKLALCALPINQYLTKIVSLFAYYL